MSEGLRLPLTIAIPTYRREQVLLDTIAYLLDMPATAVEILLLDQTEDHEPATEQALGRWAGEGKIRWLRLTQPSIPRAMNRALLEASQPIVLFLDDDIRPDSGLVEGHLLAHARDPGGIIAGRIIQPWQEGVEFPADAPFHFASTKPAFIEEFMGGNFSISKDLALDLGGFDENFVRVAYRFEAEFAHRFRAAGLAIFFEPAACLHHLKADAGGTRTYGDHLLTWRPDHAVGAYYYALRARAAREFLMRPFRAVTTRYHWRRPWRIPVTLLAEVSGMIWAVGLQLRGPRHVRRPESKINS